MRASHTAVALAALLCLACAEPGAPTDESRADAAIRVTANVSGTPVASLVVEVTAAEIAVPLLFNLTVDDASGVATGTLRVPPGPARTFLVTAFDGEGNVTHEGQATVDVRPGQNPPLQLPLGARAGQVPIEVSLGSFSVIVTPGEVALAGPGSTVQLVVEVTDENGAPVPNLDGLQWATSAPWVAAVDDAGLVTAVEAGTASVVATFDGVAGLALVTVTGSSSVDADGDGWTADVDCDDAQSSIHPGAVEVVDGADNDCDGGIDDTLADGITVADELQGLSVIRADGIVAMGTASCVGGTGTVGDPDYSSDGSRLAFVWGGDIWVMDANGESCSRLTSTGDDADPDWSPDGTRIAFARRDGASAIWTMAADGSGAAALLPGHQPDWSPDGTRFAFVGTDGKAYLANADGTGAARLTATSASGEWDPAWSPDGSRIAFRWGCLDSEVEGCALTNFAEIYIIDADGTGQFQLTSSNGDNLEPAWSPDGTRIAYVHATSGLGSGFIHLIDVATSFDVGPYTSIGQRHPTWASTASIP